MPEGLWSWLATPGAVLIVAALVAGTYLYFKNKGTWTRSGFATVFGIGASTYVYLVLIGSQLIFKGPSVSALIHDGFGDDRIAWLLTIVAADGVYRIYEQFA